jgi:ABC-type transport system substrate-binding protein
MHHGVVWIAAARGLRPLPPVSGLELRISTPYKLLNVDPVQRAFPMDEQLSYATCANLLNYSDSAGPDGTHLRPEIAAAMPRISRDGLTYTFRIRPGFRFSPPSNEPVTAVTFRHTIERTLYKTAQGWPYAPDIVGAAEYSAGRANHVSGIVARGATLSITLVRPAGDLLTRLSLPVFCPVPLSTPLDSQRTVQPIASTGPYYIASVEPHRVVLLRNPGYPGSRPRRATRIVLTDNIPTPKAVALVDGGQLDYLPPDFAAGSLMEPGGALDRRYGPASAAGRAGGQRFFLHPQPILDTIVFNTRRPLFHDLRLRRAVGFALDRPALAKAYADVPAERIVPAVIPGFAAAHVYPLDGPDLRVARRLAGRRLRHAVLLAPCHPEVAGAAAVLRSNLARIGITLEIVTSDACNDKSVAAAFAHADLMIGTNLLGRGPPDRDPAPYLDDALAHGAYGAPLGPGPWNAPAFRRRVDQARALRGEARLRAYRRLDDELVRQAPLAVYGAFLYDEYFSRRIGCRLFQRFYQVVDLGALCAQRQ